MRVSTIDRESRFEPCATAANPPARALVAPLLVAALCLPNLLHAELASLSFRRGDSNGDGTVDLSDGVNTLDFLFVGNRPLPCRDASDANDSGLLDIADAIFTFSFLFLGDSRLPPPGLRCGRDPTPDVAGDLGCIDYTQCGPAPGPTVPSFRLGAGGAVELDVSLVSEFSVLLEWRQIVNIEARNITPGLYPVLHLLGSKNSEVARSSPEAGEVPRLVYEAPAAGSYRVVVRAVESAGAEWGACDLVKDGVPWRAGVTFGGTLSEILVWDLAQLRGRLESGDTSTSRKVIGSGPSREDVPRAGRGQGRGDGAGPDT